MLADLTNRGKQKMIQQDLKLFMFVRGKLDALIAIGLHFIAASQWNQLNPREAFGQLGIKFPDSLPNDWSFFDFASLAKIQFHDGHKTVQANTDIDGEITFFIGDKNND